MHDDNEAILLDPIITGADQSGPIVSEWLNNDWIPILLFVWLIALSVICLSVVVCIVAIWHRLAVIRTTAAHGDEGSATARRLTPSAPSGQGTPVSQVNHGPPPTKVR